MATSMNEMLRDNPVTLTLEQGDLYNVNDNVKKDVKTIQSIATALAQKLKDPKSYEFFCKVAWKLPENKIWLICDKALTGNNPKAYFTYLCKMELDK